MTQELLFWLVIFAVSMYVLIRSSDMLSDSAEKIGLAIGLPDFIVGVTIVSIGTSLPELVSSLLAVAEGSSEIVVGNVIGSNITNIFLVLGIGAIIAKKLEVKYELIHVDLPIFIGSTFLLALMLLDGIFTLYEGIICLVGLGIYLLYTVHAKKKTKKIIRKEIKREHGVKNLDFINIIVLIVSTFLLYLSARYTLHAMISISEILNIAKEFMAISIFALGTSLPEIMVTITAAKKGLSEMVVGNILGSSIFNSFGVMGISALYGTIVVPSTILTFILPILIVAALLYFFITQDKQITQWEGMLLILFYIFFLSEVVHFI